LQQQQQQQQQSAAATGVTDTTALQALSLPRQSIGEALFTGIAKNALLRKCTFCSLCLFYVYVSVLNCIRYQCLTLIIYHVVVNIITIVGYT